MASKRTGRQSPSGPRNVRSMTRNLDYGTIPSHSVGSITLSGVFTYAGSNGVLTGALGKAGDAVVASAVWPTNIGFAGANISGELTSPVITLRLVNPTDSGINVGTLPTNITAILNS